MRKKFVSLQHETERKLPHQHLNHYTIEHIQLSLYEIELNRFVCAAVTKKKKKNNIHDKKKVTAHCYGRWIVYLNFITNNKSKNGKKFQIYKFLIYLALRFCIF